MTLHVVAHGAAPAPEPPGDGFGDSFDLYEPGEGENLGGRVALPLDLGAGPLQTFTWGNILDPLGTSPPINAFALDTSGWLDLNGSETCMIHGPDVGSSDMWVAAGVGRTASAAGFSVALRMAPVAMTFVGFELRGTTLRCYDWINGAFQSEQTGRLTGVQAGDRVYLHVAGTTVKMWLERDPAGTLESGDLTGVAADGSIAGFGKTLQRISVWDDFATGAGDPPGGVP